MIDRHLRRQLRRPHRWLADRFRTRSAVLMYHGIGEPGIDPWGLFVSPENFDAHLRVLDRIAVPTPLERLAADGATDGAVAVTFDDGYANVKHEAEPLLATRGVPATLFVVSGCLDPVAEYWWDELAGLVLEPGRIRPHLTSTTPGVGLDLRVDAAAVDYTIADWRRDHSYRDEEGPASPRMTLYRELWRHLSPLEHATRQAALDEIAGWVGRTRAVRESHRSLTTDELVELDGDVVTIGGHTTNHHLLPEIDPARQRTEIGHDRRRLAELLGRPVTAFSYPFGANDASSVAAVRAAGYDVAVTARPETVNADTDPFRIGRFDVKNWTGDDFERRLRNWLRFR